MNSPGLAAEVAAILKYSAVAETMTPETRHLLEEVARKGSGDPEPAPTGEGLFSPFQRPAPAGWGVPYVEVCGVEDRIRLVREMDIEQLERVVAIGWAIQRTVLLAAERRLRMLRRKATR